MYIFFAAYMVINLRTNEKKHMKISEFSLPKHLQGLEQSHIPHSEAFSYVKPNFNSYLHIFNIFVVLAFFLFKTVKFISDDFQYCFRKKRLANFY